jgi:hypothetical protein
LYQDQESITSATNTVDVVKGYFRDGMAPIPIPPKRKNPGRCNWQYERWTVEEVPRLWNNGQNVGILLGEPSGWRVDVDCDCPEAVRLAPRILPKTLKGGRETAPGSHYWYISEGCKSKPYFGTANTPNERKRILELRSDGCHTLVYPSVHPDDEDTYQWYPDLSEKMTRIEAEELRRRVNLLFTATIVARHMPPIGGRHDYANALAGFLLRNERLSEEEARLVLVSAWELFEDADRDALLDVQNSVKTAARRLGEKKPVTGGGALALYSEHLPKAIADGWDWSIDSDEDPSYTWGTPEEIPESLPPVKEFDYRILPDAFRPWVQDVSERMQVPPDFVAAPLMVTLSAVVGRKVGIQPKRYDDWTVVPNLWGAIVGRPGLLKSPALKGALAPLSKLISEAGERHKEAKREYEREVELHQARVEWYTAEKRKLAKAGDMSAVENFINDNSPEDEPEPPRECRYRTSDATVEKLGELLNQNPNGLLLYRDELVGWLRGLDRYGREGDRAFFLEAWAGDQGHDVDRIERGSLHVPALTMAVLGGIQPGPLSSYVYDAGSDAADDDGLLPRFQLLVWPDHNPDFENVDRYPDHKAKASAFDVFDFADRLLEYEAPEDGEIPTIRFSPEAQDIFDCWRLDLEREVRGGELSPAMESHKSKYRSLMPSLALLLEIADSAKADEVVVPDTEEVVRAIIGKPPETVGEASTLRAAAWCEYLESHARRVYHSAENPGVRAGRELLKRIRRGDIEHGEQVRLLYRRGWSGLKTREAVDAALEILSDFGWCRVLRIGTGSRPSEVVLLHPDLRDTGK